MEYTQDLGSCAEMHARSSRVSPTILYGPCKILGPYTLPSGRKHITIRFDNGTRKNISYARFLYESAYGKLKNDEHVHHKDGDYTNDELSNLEALVQKEHVKSHKPIKEELFSCLACGNELKLSGTKLSTLKSNLKRNKRGPYCSGCRPVNQYS